VYFSRSPLAHQTFFKERNSYFTRIDLSADELGEYHSFLILLGLKYAAVTSPLKEKLFSIATVKTKQAEELKSANTLLFANNRLSCHNTDLDGFLALMQTEKPGLPVAVWGGGGTLQMLKQALPNAVLFSSQTGQTREVQSEQITHFKALVWAAPRTAQTQFPSDTLNFESVIDLNYTENSMGLEFAARRKISYISGLEMFKAQAEAQQVFWRAQEGNS
ncbi:MAG: shikimate kinase, partial [Pseudobdellovibrio sp.]